SDGDLILGSPPVAGSFPASTAEETQLLIPVADFVAAASDADGDSLSFVSVDGATNGVALIQGDQVQFTPTADFSGDATIQYTIEDLYGVEASGSLTVTVIPINDAPDARSDTFVLGESGTTTASVFANNGAGADDDVDGPGPLQIVSILGEASLIGQAFVRDGASLSLTADGSIKIDTNGSFEQLSQGQTDTISLDYAVSDGAGLTDIASISIRILGENDAPTALDDAFDMLGTQTLSGQLFADNGIGVDSDPDTLDTLSVIEVDGATRTDAEIFLPSGGELSVFADGSFEYDPAGIAIDPINGAVEQFSYTISDGRGETQSANVTIDIEGGNTNPDARNDLFSVAEDSFVTGNLLADNGSGVDTDAEGDTLTVIEAGGSGLGQAVDLPSGAQIIVGINGDVTYDPRDAFDTLGQNQTDSDSFTYTVTDGAGGSDTASVIVNILGRNEAPSAQDDVIELVAGSSITADVFADNSNGADADQNGDMFSVVAVNGESADIGATITFASGAIAVIAADGSASFDATGAYADVPFGSTETETVTYTIEDVFGAQDTAFVDFTILSNADAPDLVISAASVDAGKTGEQVQAQYTILNQGSGMTSGEIVQRLYFSSDTILDDDDEIAGEYTFSPMIDPGESFGFSVPITLPDSTGPVHLIVQTDATETQLELNESNNTTASASVSVSAAYESTLVVSAATAIAGQTVSLSGVATDPVSGSVASYEFVTIRAETADFSQTFSAFTALDGSWSYDFTPPAGIAGSFDLTATHPGNLLGELPQPDATVDYYGVAFVTAVPQYVIAGQQLQFDIAVVNLGDLGLTGAGVSLQPLPDDWTGSVVLDSSTIVGDGSATATVTLDIPVTETLTLADVELSLATAEGGNDTISIPIGVTPPFARLSVSDVEGLDGALVRGEVEYISFTLTNDGGADSGPITIGLPEIDWFGSLNADILPSLGADESTEITLALTPDDGVPLGTFTGSFPILLQDGSGVGVDFDFDIISDAVGTLQLDLVDELTFFAEGAPKIDDVMVEVTNAVTGEVIFSSNDVDGSLTLTDIPEGYYEIRATASDHDPYYASVFVDAGETTSTEAFMSRQTVKYYWSVEEIEIEDRYEVSIEAEFAVNVPAPVVVIDPPIIDLHRLQERGDSEVFEITVTNHGLIAVQDVDIGLDPHPLYDIDIPFDVLQELGAKSSITVPVTITMLETLDDYTARYDAAQGALEGGEDPAKPFETSELDLPPLDTAPSSIPCQVGGGVSYVYDCGPHTNYKWVMIEVINPEGECPPGGGPGVGGPGGGGFLGFGTGSIGGGGSGGGG
ncbi:MAG: Ig-like domain-containing protein, partial [Pseudomonadota bacterium]